MNLYDCMNLGKIRGTNNTTVAEAKDEEVVQAL
jgi:hypothetical protein